MEVEVGMEKYIQYKLGHVGVRVSVCVCGMGVRVWEGVCV